MLSKSVENCIINASRSAYAQKHDVVTIEHLLLAMLDEKLCMAILDFCGADIPLLRHQLKDYLSTKLEIVEDPKQEPVQTIALQRVIQRVYLHIHGSTEKEANTGHILISMCKETSSYGIFFLRNQNIARLDIINAMNEIANMTRNNDGELSKILQATDNITDPDIVKEGAFKKRKPEIHTLNKKSSLDNYTTNLNLKAKNNAIDQIIGRDKELERTILVLCRRKKNNPLFVGEPGVGKTALAEGLAMMVINGQIPEMLANAEIFALDLSGLLAGTKFRGDFEQRLKTVINDLKSLPNPILFIDEIHTLVGAGSTSGSSIDAANVLKPLLANGELKCIGATTFSEYRNIFQKDSALSRRFQKIDVLEPSVSETYNILKGLKSKYEQHYNIAYTNIALRTAAELSNKYIHSRFLPDKAIDVIDEAGAAFLLAKKAKNKNDKTNKRKAVGVAEIEKVVSMIARIPAAKASANELELLQTLEFDLKKKIFGQDQAIEKITASIKRNKAGLKHPDRPIAVFLLSGPTGVGKTELTKQLSKLMNMHFERFDMSEYMEKHSVARLIGAPPGYIGYEQGGLLTESINKQPYSVLLFDEIEKAHHDLFNILLQVMDYGKLTDNNGQKTDFRNVIIIMTSNVGSQERSSKQMGFQKATNLREQEAIDTIFPPEFRNRIDSIISFNNLTQKVMINVVNKFIDELKEMLLSRKIKLSIDIKAKNWFAKNGFSNEFGARPLNRLIQTEISDTLSEQILFGTLARGGTVKVTVLKNKIKLIFNNNKELDKDETKALAYEK